MTNIINTAPNPQSADMWQYPVGIDKTAGDIAEMQQGNYADFLAAPDLESQAVEHGLPTTRIREGAATVNNLEVVPASDQLIGYETQNGNVIDPQSAEAVLTSAAQVVNEAYAALPEAQQVQLHQEHQQAANTQAAVYAPYIEKMREHALQDDFRLAA